MTNKKNILSKTLTTGADGMVGSYVDFGIRTNRRSLDVTDLNEVLRMVKGYRPKVILHLAAETDVDRCERDPMYAYQVNTIGTYNMVLAAQEAGAKFVFVSTLGVFDGMKKGPYSKKDRPDPKNFYGHSKYLAEVIVRDRLDDYLIVRGGWMFGGGPKKDQKFVAKIIKQFGNNKIVALSDTIGSPTFGKDLISAIKVLIEKDAKGSYHITNKGTCSRYDVAREIVNFFDKKIKVIPANSKTDLFNLSVKRVLNESSVSDLNLMRPWKDALREYLKTEWADFVRKI